MANVGKLSAAAAAAFAALFSTGTSARTTVPTMAEFAPKDVNIKVSQAARASIGAAAAAISTRDTPTFKLALKKWTDGTIHWMQGAAAKKRMMKERMMKEHR